MTLHVSESIVLELIDHHHAAPLPDLLNSNREHLKEWLPWVDHMQTVDDFKRYITQSKKKQDDKMELGFVILYNGIVAGRIGLHYFDHQNKICAVGYWLGKEFVGKGIITSSCKKLLQHAFTELGFNRIEIKCGVGNDKSAAVPQRLGFTREGILRQAELVNGRFIDLILYSMLKSDQRSKSDY